MGTRAVPLLPTGSIEESTEFATSLGFVVTYRQSAPHPYVALRGEAGVELHYFHVPHLDPADSHGACLLVVPDPADVLQRWSAALVDRYGAVPTDGFPRLLQPRAEPTSTTFMGFSMVDPAGNRIRVVREAVDTGSDAPESPTPMAVAPAVLPAESDLAVVAPPPDQPAPEPEPEPGMPVATDLGWPPPPDSAPSTLPPPGVPVPPPPGASSAPLPPEPEHRDRAAEVVAQPLLAPPPPPGAAAPHPSTTPLEGPPLAAVTQPLVAPPPDPSPDDTDPNQPSDEPSPADQHEAGASSEGRSASTFERHGVAAAPHHRFAALVYLAELSLRLGRLDDARAHLHEAETIDPESPALTDLRAALADDL